MTWHPEPFPWVMETHVTDEWPEWGSAPRGPLITCDMAHRGELMASVIGESVTTLGKQVVYHVVRCELCIAIHIWPLPSETDLAAYYARRFYDGPAAQEVAQHERDQAWYEKCCYGPVLAQCERLLPSRGPQYPLRVLDIGAGSGLLLDTAHKRGWCTMGLEPDQRCCNALAARDHLMCAGTLATHTQCVERWQPDVITIWEMLEHTVCPEDVLLQVYDVMQPGALLVVSVPNDWNPLQMAVCKKFDLAPYWLIPPVHTFYWTPKTLQLCVRRCGFRLLDMRGTYPMEQLMLYEDGQCYIGDSVRWREYTDDKNAMELEICRQGRWAQQEHWYRENLRTRRGRSIICLAQKE